MESVGPVLDGLLAQYLNLKQAYFNISNSNAAPHVLDQILKELVKNNELFKRQVELATLMNVPIEGRWVEAIDECNKACVAITSQLESLPIESPIAVVQQTFIKHSKLIRCVDKMQDIFDNFKEFGIDLPRIVVIGEENVGKSSVLESIAGVRIFPRAEGICTRLPFKMIMHHRSTERMIKDYGTKVADPSNAVIVSFADKPDTLLSDPEEIRARVSQITADKTKGYGVRDDVVILNIYSTKVADLTIIDLPGIINASRKNEPANIKDVTLNIVKRYITEKDVDTIILAVVPANQSLGNSQALGEVQLAHAENRTIGVITKVDLATLRDKVDQKILGTNADTVTLPNGYIGVINADTEAPQGFTEAEYFSQKFPELWQREKVGCLALIKQLNVLMDKHIRDSWAPKTKKFILSKQTDVKRLLDGLGAPVPSSDLKSFFKGQISEFCTMFTKDVDSHLTHMGLLTIQKARELSKKSKVDVVTGMVDYVRHSYLKDIILKNSLDNCKLSRFTNLCDTIRLVYEQQSKIPRDKCHALVVTFADTDSVSLPAGVASQCCVEAAVEQCTVCQRPIDKTDLDSGGVATLQCTPTNSHPLHLKCFMELTRMRDPKCPTCRAPVPSKLEKPPLRASDSSVDPLMQFTLKAITKRIFSVVLLIYL